MWNDAFSRMTRASPAPRRIRSDFFSTAGLAAADRHEAWENRGWPSLAPLYATEPVGPFQTSSQTAHFGGVTAIYADMTAQRWERDAAMVRARAHDALGINIGLIGGARGIMGERSFDQPQGAAIVTDLAQTSRHEGTGGRSIQLLFPRAMAVGAGLDVRAMHGLVLDSPPVHLLTSHALRMRESLPGLTEEDGPRLARSLLDLLLIAIGAEGRVDAGDAAASTALLRAHAEIDRNLGSAALTIANLCRRLQMSRSTLHRLFEAEGGVQAYIRDRRLDAAREALLDADNRERIGALAERLGFSDSAHLSRLFRRRFGHTPSDCRARALERG